MKKNKFKHLKRLLVVGLVFSLLIGESTLTAFANADTEVSAEMEVSADAEVSAETEVSADAEVSAETEESVDAEEDNDNHTLVIFEEDGSVTYETVTEQNQTKSNSANAVILNDMEGGEPFSSQDDNQISALASGLSDVSMFSITQVPYKYSCMIISRFPNGKGLATSGILVGKNIVLASGHGVYMHDWGGEATSVMVGVGTYYTSDGKMETQYPSCYKKRMILDTAWVNDKKDSGDWALITLPDNYDSYQLTGYAPDYTKAIGRSIRLLGYPGERFCTSTGTITGTTDDSQSDERYRGLWITSAQSEEGMSGGPMIDEATGAVIGVVKGKERKSFKNVEVPLRKFIIDAIATYSN